MFSLISQLQALSNCHAPPPLESQISPRVVQARRKRALREASKKERLSREILKIMESTPRPMSSTELAQTLNVGRTTVGARLIDLAQQKRVFSFGRARSAKWSLTKE